MKAIKLPSGNYRVQVSRKLNGKTIRKSITASTIGEAIFLAEQWKENATELVKPNNKTFNKAIDNYIESKSNILSPSTIRGYRIMQRNSFPLLDNVKLKDITQEMVQEQININAGKYSYKSCKNQLGLISAVLGRSYKVSLPPKTKVEYCIPSPDDIPVILKIVKDTDIELQILFALLLGLRQSEIAALKWENLKGNKIHVIGAIVRDEFGGYVEKKTNKSVTSTRTLSVPDYLLNKLNKIKKENGRMFNDTPHSVYKKWVVILKKNGMPPFRLHDLRHAYASLMLLLGTPDKYAMQILGQSDPSMIKNVYQHTFNKELDIIADKLNNYFNNFV